jgi:hypothetical protein
MQVIDVPMISCVLVGNAMGNISVTLGIQSKIYIPSTPLRSNGQFHSFPDGYQQQCTLHGSRPVSFPTREEQIGLGLGLISMT